jgi:hypothetical protein
MIRKIFRTELASVARPAVSAGDRSVRQDGFVCDRVREATLLSRNRRRRAMSEASAPTGRWLSRALWRWFEITGRDYMRAMGVPPDDSRTPEPVDAYIADGIAQIERFLARQLRLRQ